MSAIAAVCRLRAGSTYKVLRAMPQAARVTRGVSLRRERGGSVSEKLQLLMVSETLDLPSHRGGATETKDETGPDGRGEVSAGDGSAPSDGHVVVEGN